MIRCHLSTLMGRDKLRIADVSRRTGLNRSTITALYKETTTRVDLPAIEQLCRLVGREPVASRMMIDTLRGRIDMRCDAAREDLGFSPAFSVLALPAVPGGGELAFDVALPPDTDTGTDGSGEGTASESEGSGTTAGSTTSAGSSGAASSDGGDTGGSSTGG